jgi:hypothetical protein
MTTEAESSPDAARGGAPAIAWLAWVWVSAPFAYGLYQLVIKIPALFGS